MALATAFVGMVAYRLARGQRWMATGLAAIGSANLVNFVAWGKGSLLEHRVIFIASVALVILFIAAMGAAQKDRERDLGRFFR
jgi:hypothetical protein